MSNNLIFHELSLRNFMSYGNATTTINLNNPGTTHIQGRNLDNTEKGIGANGTGKSTLINGLVYALYGEALTSDIKVDDLINDINLTNCIVSLSFNLNNDHYLITRYRKHKDGPESNYVTVFKNHDKTFDLSKAKITDTNKFIIELIDMPKELFVRLVVFDADDESFFKLSANKTRDILENLFQITILSEKAEAIKVQFKDKKIELDIQQLKLDQLKCDHVAHEARLSNAIIKVDHFNTCKQSKLDTLTKHITDLSDINIDEQREIFTQIDINQTQIDIINNEKISDVQHELDASNQKTLSNNSDRDLKIANCKSKHAILISNNKETLVNFNEVIRNNKDQNTQLRHELEQTSAKQQTSQQQIDTLEQTNKQINIKFDEYRDKINILKTNKCPECKQHVTDDSNLEKYINLQDGLQVELQSNNTIISNLLKIIDDYGVQLSDIEINIEQCGNDVNVTNAIKQISTITSEMQEYEQQHQKDLLQITNLFTEQDQLITNYTDQLKKAKKALLLKIEYITRDQLIPIFESIEDLNMVANKITQLQHEFSLIENDPNNPYQELLNDMENERPVVIDYSNLNQIKKIMDHQQFLIKALSDKKSFIRKKLISSRLPHLNEQLKHYLQHMGLPYQVEFKSDLTPSIKRRGRYKSFGNLSHGQKARVNFALMFAFRDVLEQMHSKVNICMLDEVLDKALCGVGANGAVTMINEKAKESNLSMFIITHKSELATKFQHHMTVTIEKGFSSIEHH